MQISRLLLLLPAVVFLGFAACEKHSFSETKHIHLPHGDHGDHGDHDTHDDGHGKGQEGGHDGHEKGKGHGDEKDGQSVEKPADKKSPVEAKKKGDSKDVGI